MTSSAPLGLGARGLVASRPLRARLATSLFAIVLAALASACEAPPDQAAKSAPPRPEATSGPTAGAPTFGVAASGETAATPPEPEAISPLDIPAALERTDARLRQIHALLRPSKEVREIEAVLPGLTPALDEARRSILEWPLLQRTRRALLSHRREWQGIDERLERAAETLNRRSAPILVALDDLGSAHEVWALTAGGDLGDLPVGVARRVRDIPTAVSDLAAAVRQRRDKLISLQSSVASARIDIADFYETIDAAIEEEQRRLWVRESPPLWKGLASPGDVRTAAEQLSRAWEEGRRALHAFGKLYGSRIWIHGLSVAALIAMLLVLRRRIDRRERPARVRAAWSSLLAQPVAAALILGLASSGWIYPRAPAVVFLLVALALLPAVLAILGRLLPARLLGAVWTLGGLYVLDRLLESALPGASVHRVLLLVLTGGALAATLWHFRRTGPLASSFSGWRRRAAELVMRALMLALVTSLAADVLGNASLGQFLTGLVLRLVYLALVTFALVIILRGLLVISVHSAAAERLSETEKRREALEARASRWINIIAVGLWVVAALEASRILDPLLSVVRAILGRHLAVGPISISLGDVLTFVLTLYASIVLSRLISFIVQETGAKGVGGQRSVRGAVAVLVRYAMITLGFVLALGAAGIHFDRLTVLLGALGVGVGFGLQGLINNFVSGLVLAFERPVQVGDVIEVGGLLGRAKEIGFRASTIETFDGADVIVPNGELLASHLVNWTLTDQTRRIEVKVGVKYGTDPARVIGLLEEVARAHPDALASPASFAVFRGFGESSLDFSLFVWTADFDRWIRIQSEVSVQVNTALRDAGIEIPYPQRDLHLRSGWPPPGGATHL